MRYGPPGATSPTLNCTIECSLSTLFVCYYLLQSREGLKHNEEKKNFHFQSLGGLLRTPKHICDIYHLNSSAPMSQVYPHHDAGTNLDRLTPQLFTVWKKALFFSGTGFTVFDSSGNLILRVENYTPTVKRQMILMDAAGKPLLLLRRKVMSLHHRWEVFICNENDGSPKSRVFSIHRSSIISATTSVDVFTSCSWADYLRRHWDYRIEGSFGERYCAIYNRSGTMVAQVKRKRGSCDMLLEKDVFSLVVYPGFDPTLIMSWIVVVDRIDKDHLRVLVQAALRYTFRSYRLIKRVDIDKKGESTGNEARVKGKSP